MQTEGKSTKRKDSAPEKKTSANVLESDESELSIHRIELITGMIDIDNCSTTTVKTSGNDEKFYSRHKFIHQFQKCRQTETT